MSEFACIYDLVDRFSGLGAVKVFFKRLTENDNSKQQIYLGGSFEVLSLFPYGEVKAYPGLREPNFKADLKLVWVSPESHEEAPNTQLILYPKYPEVRLSGFLKGCQMAPSPLMQPVPKEKRRGVDGRVLFFGITRDRRTLAYVAPEDSGAARHAITHHMHHGASVDLFTELPVKGGSGSENRTQLLTKLGEIHRMGFVDSMKLDRTGKPQPYQARNGGGYTLEALLGICPNCDASPDYLGWEVKSFSKSNITLMTPEPDGGLYGEQGAEAFIRKFGHPSKENQLYFSGTHRFGQYHQSTGLKLELDGFSPASGKLEGVCGAILLQDKKGMVAASWGFADLLTHWNRKHASAVYVRYEARDLPGKGRQYQYQSSVSLAEHTDFTKWLSAIADGSVIFDPGSKLDNASAPQGRGKVKARNQFRISFKKLACLYGSFEDVEL